MPKHVFLIILGMPATLYLSKKLFTISGLDIFSAAYIQLPSELFN